MNKERKDIRSRLPIYLSLVLILGFWIGILVSPFKKADLIDDVIRFVEKEYVDTVDADRLKEKAVNEMLQYLDPHSYFIPSEDLQNTNEQLQGSFEGIGVQFRIQKDTIVVIQTVSGGPSEKIGLRAGDRIVEVEGEIVAGVGISNNDVLKKLKGPRGTVVNVGIFRSGADQILDFPITRDVIPSYSIDAKFMATSQIAYIKVSKFAANTPQEFASSLYTLKRSGMKKLILDLRGNGGGYLEAAITMADEFLSEGKLIVFTKGRSRPKQEAFATGGGLFEKGAVVILIDEWSASASEIVAGAVQDNDRGWIVGRRSFGKGLVQEQFPMKSGAALRLTIARYYTPTGRCIQRSYKDGVEDYYADFYERFENGELSESDSVHFPDSLKYKTPKGKIVYGGGGIMPDYFISVDIPDSLDYFRRLINRGLIYQFAFDFTDANREDLNKYEGVSAFDKKFIVTEAIMKDFLDYAKSKGVPFNEDSFNKSRERIEHRFKAFVARNIFDDKGFYPIFLRKDKAFLKAIQVLEKEQ